MKLTESRLRKIIREEMDRMEVFEHLKAVIQQMTTLDRDISPYTGDMSLGSWSYKIDKYATAHFTAEPMGRGTIDIEASCYVEDIDWNDFTEYDDVRLTFDVRGDAKKLLRYTQAKAKYYEREIEKEIM